MKIGQTVVLMDSNDRGIIRSIGKNSIKIELEDGLVIEAVQGEFALTSAEEESQMRSSRPTSVKYTDAPCRKKIPSNGILTIDLHIERLDGGRMLPPDRRLEYQLEFFRRTLRENLKHKGLKITFIHGTGDGILRNAVRNELNQCFAISCSYEVGDPAVTKVTIK